MTQFVSHYQIKEQPTTTYSINENGKHDNQLKTLTTKACFYLAELEIRNLLHQHHS